MVAELCMFGCWSATMSRHMRGLSFGSMCRQLINWKKVRLEGRECAQRFRQQGFSASSGVFWRGKYRDGTGGD